MGKMFTEDGKLYIPIRESIAMPKEKVDIDEKAGDLVVKAAYCHNGHNMISEVIVDNYPGIHIVYTDLEGGNRAEVVISSVVARRTRVFLSGEPFDDEEIVKILCPTCNEELPILCDCECGAPIYLLYLDKRLQPQYAHSFCSRTGCVKASQLRFSGDVLREFKNKYSF